MESTQEKPFVGYWEGHLKLFGQLLPFSVRFTFQSENLQGTIDIQDSAGLSLSEIRFKNKNIHFELKTSQSVGTAVFDGELVDTESNPKIVGKFQQAGVICTFLHVIFRITSAF
jgi:hypothetical protein